MKNSFKRAAFIAASIASVLFVACDKEEADVTKPTINLISPAEDAILAAGNESGVHFEMELEDNVALGSYKIEIHNSFDGHEHASASKADADDSTESDEEETVDFTFYKTYDDISGQRNATVHHHDIVIPANATYGSYHMMIYCTDSSGNESYVVRYFYIGDEDSSDEEDHDHDEE